MKAIISVLSGAKRCIWESSFSSSPESLPILPSRVLALRRTLGPMPCSDFQPIFLRSLAPIVSPLDLKTSITCSRLFKSPSVDPSPVKLAEFSSFSPSALSARSSSSIKSSGRCVVLCGILLAFASGRYKRRWAPSFLGANCIEVAILNRLNQLSFFVRTKGRENGLTLR